MGRKPFPCRLNLAGWNHPPTTGIARGFLPATKKAQPDPAEPDSPHYLRPPQGRYAAPICATCSWNSSFSFWMMKPPLFVSVMPITHSPQQVRGLESQGILRIRRALFVRYLKANGRIC